MAKELPYFKFEPSEWMFGRIQKCSGDSVKVFTNLCCKYWHELGDLKLEDVLLDFPELELNSLIQNKIVKIAGENIRINFLDRQFDEIRNFSSIQSVKGKISAEKRARDKSTTVEPVLNQSQPLLNPVQPEVNQIQPIIEDKIILDKKRLDNTVDGKILKVIEYLKGQVTWHESICARHKIPAAEINTRLTGFEQHLKAQQKLPSKQEAFAHFDNWLRIQIEHEKRTAKSIGSHSKTTEEPRTTRPTDGYGGF